MHLLRLALAALAVAALIAAPDAAAKKGHKKGHKKGPRAAWIERGERRGLERDLARLVAARPRLPDGSRVLLNAGRAPRLAAPAPVRRLAPAARPLAAPMAAVTAQRRASAVDAYLRSHPPAY